MSRVKKIAVLLLCSMLGLTPLAAEGGVAPNAAALKEFGHGWAITNSMLTGWAVSILLVALLLWLIGKPSIVPSRGQLFFESILEWLRDMLAPVMGKKAFSAVFPILVTFFLFILFHNWMGLIPGVGTLGWGHDVDGHFHLTEPLIRPFNSDFNSTIALALISFGAWAIIVFKFTGPKHIFLDLFGNKADKKETPGWLYPVLSFVFFAVGLIEVFSIVIRPFTLSVRLFGNIYGGENLLHGTSFIFVFYFMELLVGLIQALVFTLLTAVYIGMLCGDHGDEHDHEEKPGAGAAAPH